MALNPVRVAWIDDDEEHSEDANHIQRQKSSLKITFVLPKEFERQLESWGQSQSKPDLFLIDFRLDGQSQPSGRFRRRGLSLGSQVRERFPEHPIYGFSAYPGVEGIFGALSGAARGVFEQVLDYKTLQREGAMILFCDGQDYTALRKRLVGRLDSKDFQATLRVPLVSLGDVMRALPATFRTGLARSRGVNSIAFARWLRRVLLSYPGPLHDSMFSATQLGLTEAAFLKVSRRFRLAKYQGFFARTTRPLWWSRELNRLMLRLCSPYLESGELTSKAAMCGLSVGQRSIAKCAVCGQDNPETVGYTVSGSARAPVHFRCSDSHPFMERTLYFDEPRIYPPQREAKGVR